MQSLALSSTGSSSVSQSSATGAVHRSSVQARPHADSLNRPASAATQPVEVTVASYAPDQPQSVDKARTDLQVQHRQESERVQAREVQTAVQTQDRHVASNALTGEYDAAGARKVGAPRVGGYLAVVA